MTLIISYHGGDNIILKKTFDHQEIEGLYGRANLMEYQPSAENSKSLQVNPSAIMKFASMIIQNSQ